MKPIDQTIFGFPDGNCLAASIASITGIDLDALSTELRVEWTTETNWLAGMIHVLQSRGFSVVHFDNIDAPPDGYAVVFGPASRGFAHACVTLNGAVVHDPHPSRDGLISVTGYLVTTPIERMEMVS